MNNKRFPITILLGFLLSFVIIGLFRHLPFQIRGVGYVVSFALAWALAPIFAPFFSNGLVAGAKKRVKGSDPLTIVKEKEWTVINATPPHNQIGMTIRAWVMAAIIGWMVGGLAGLVTFGWVLFFIIGVLFTFLFRALTLKARQIQDYSFAVGPEGIRIPCGKVIPRMCCGSITTRNVATGQIYASGMVFGSGVGGMIAGGMQSTFNGMAVVNAMSARKLATMSYSVELDHDGISTVLAGGLTDTLSRQTADAVMQALKET